MIVLSTDGSELSVIRSAEESNLYAPIIKRTEEYTTGIHFRHLECYECVWRLEWMFSSFTVVPPERNAPIYYG